MKRYKHLIGAESKDLIERYVSSTEFDTALAKHAAAVMLAHIEGLARAGLIPRGAYEAMRKALIEVVATGGESLYSWIGDREFEDVFEALELYLYDVAGPDAGRAALGRSRNDHVAAVLRLAARERVLSILEQMLGVREAFIEKALRYKGVILPFFTHTQVAQCGTAPNYFLAHEQAMADAWRAVLHSLEYLRQSPLGSGASAGAYLRIDPSIVEQKLCLDPDPIPPYYATGSRLFLIYTASAVVTAMTELSRFAEDMITLLITVPEGVELPPTHISTSSIMPHKRNPVTLEVARAKAAGVIGGLTALLATYKSLPYGYSLDFQEMNKHFLRILEDAEETLQVIRDFIDGVRLRAEVLEGFVRRFPCWSSDVIEYVAIETGRPLRELYAELAHELHSGGEGAGQARDFLRRYGVSDPLEVVKGRPSEKGVDELIERAVRRLRGDEALLKTLRGRYEECMRNLVGEEGAG